MVKKRVKVWPILGLRALIANHGGAWRLWSLARSIDPQGSGIVARDDLWALLDHLGVDRRTVRRWLSDAKRVGLIVELYWKRSGAVLILTGAERAARLFGCHSIGRMPVSLPLRYLVGSGWRSSLWAAFLTTFRGRPVSRARMQEITGIPARTQRRWEAEAGVARRANYAVTQKNVDHLTAEREFGRSHAFRWFDLLRGDQVIAWRLPDSRQVPGYAQGCAGGRSRKINENLAASFQSGNYILRGQAVISRIFHANHKAAERTARRLMPSDWPGAEVFNLFVERFRPGFNYEVQHRRTKQTLMAPLFWISTVLARLTLRV